MVRAIPWQNRRYQRVGKATIDSGLLPRKLCAALTKQLLHELRETISSIRRECLVERIDDLGAEIRDSRAFALLK
jgi:hypothetical protein